LSETPSTAETPPKAGYALIKELSPLAGQTIRGFSFSAQKSFKVASLFFPRALRRRRGEPVPLVNQELRAEPTANCLHLAFIPFSVQVNHLSPP